MAKTLSVTIQQRSAVFFNQSQGVTLESKSTCSHVPPGLRRDWQACQQATWNTCVGKKASQTHIAHMFYCCLNQLFVVLSFHFGLGSMKTSRTVEFCGFISFCATSCILKLTYQLHKAGSARSPMSPNTVPSDILILKIQTCTYIHTWVSVWESYWLTSFSRNIERVKPPTEIVSHIFHLEKKSILMIYRS